MQALLTSIVTWLASNFGLPAEYEHPEIRFVPARHVAELRYVEIAQSQRRQVVGVYDDATRTIFLTNAWTGESPADLSILVHEMVHHLQNLSDRSYPCSVAREKLAYEAQDQWLRLFDRTLASEFEIDPLTLKVSTACWR